MSEATRRKIRQLRALADSTTFPEEAKSARAKADKLEQTIGGPQPNPYQVNNGQPPPRQAFRDAFYSGQHDAAEALFKMYMKQMEDEMLRRAFGDLFNT